MRYIYAVLYVDLARLYSIPRSEPTVSGYFSFYFLLTLSTFLDNILYPLLPKKSPLLSSKTVVRWSLGLKSQ
jgi:hypothetical protein